MKVQKLNWAGIKLECGNKTVLIDAIENFKPYFPVLGSPLTVKNGRVKKGLTLFDLEVMTELSKRQLIRIEQGKANLAAYTLLKLITTLEIDIKELFNVELPSQKK